VSHEATLGTKGMMERRTAETPRSYGVLWVATRRTADGLVVRPNGEIDLATVGDLDEALRAAEATGAATIVVDLSAVSMLDSTGLRCLVSAHERSLEAGRELRIRPGSDHLRHLFELAGLSDRLPLTS
jgi:anti-sigma B factor antagonist